MEFPDVFGYSDYRTFLQDWFKVHKRRTGRKGTSDFARMAGCSPGHVRNVVVGRRDLQAVFIEGFVRALGLTAEDATCFGLLVRCVHPLSSADRVQAARELRALQQAHGAPAPTPRRGRPRKQRAQAEDRPSSHAYSEWFHPVIRALACCPGFQDNPTWIASSLRPAISPLQVSSLLRIEREGPVERPGLPLTVPYGDRDGRAYHRSALRTARWALHNVERTERQLGATTTSLFPSQLARLRDEITRFQAEIEEIFARASKGGYIEQIRSEDPSPDSPAAVELRHGPADVVYQLTIQVFPLSRRI